VARPQSLERIAQSLEDSFQPASQFGRECVELVSQYRRVPSDGPADQTMERPSPTEAGRVSERRERVTHTAELIDLLQNAVRLDRARWSGRRFEPLKQLVIVVGSSAGVDLSSNPVQ
jgi:hypothetical protein